MTNSLHRGYFVNPRTFQPVTVVHPTKIYNKPIEHGLVKLTDQGGFPRHVMTEY